MIGVVDYGLGNIRSIVGALDRMDCPSKLCENLEDMNQVSKLILPGVGSFGDGMRNLKDRGLDACLNEAVINQKKPILGICLGAQLLGTSSKEHGDTDGLGWLDFSVNYIGDTVSLRVPHVGWNELKHSERSSILYKDVLDQALVYFTHSFHIVPNTRDIVTSECNYESPIVASVESNHIYATQFHPEKSQLTGLRILKNFVDHA